MGKWSKKERRQYEHIKASARSRGRSTRRAKEIAARTVNKRRSQTGRAASTRGRGAMELPLTQQTKQQLYDRARQVGIEGRSRMNKRQLIRALRQNW